MFTEAAELYDAIYFTFKDYAAEAADIARHIRAEHPDARSVLDVACGTGEHARLLAADHGFHVDGVDLNPEFLRLARRKHPAGRFYQADMREFSIETRYDAIICMFSSIGYVRTLPMVERTLERFRRHLAKGGVILVEPWFPPGVLVPGYVFTRQATVGDATVVRTSECEIDGRTSRLRFDYRIEDASGVRHATELHELGLFTVDEMLAAFAAAGLDVMHEAPSEGNRGMYVARARHS
jgi:ubiquinone/menaquinone biosynthesis C-methylase UbiE